MNEQNAPATISNKPQFVISEKTLAPAALSMAVRDAKIVTVRQSIESGFPSINKIVKTIGFKETASVIVMQIVRLETLLNLTKPLPPESLAEIASTVVDVCLESGININAADIDIVFRRVMKGEYGRFYGSIGMQDVVGWFNSYISEKAGEYVQIRMNESQEYNTHTPRANEFGRTYDIQRHKEAFKDYVDNLKSKENE
ncbi:MAG: hypothetical protein IJK92_01460 [Bacteroidales bacterium]|nr:hypothetical protein [Bacteroidales bacterium]